MSHWANLQPYLMHVLKNIHLCFSDLWLVGERGFLPPKNAIRWEKRHIRHRSINLQNRIWWYLAQSSHTLGVYNRELTKSPCPETICMAFESSRNGEFFEFWCLTLLSVGKRSVFVKGHSSHESFFFLRISIYKFYFFVTCQMSYYERFREYWSNTKLRKKYQNKFQKISVERKENRFIYCFWRE